MPGSKASKRLNSEEQFGTRTKKRNINVKKKGRIYVNVKNKERKPERYMLKGKHSRETKQSKKSKKVK